LFCFVVESVNVLAREHVEIFFLSLPEK